jgi:N-acetylmuramoyl-L-alanine amidase
MRENEVILIEGDYQQHYAGFDPRVPESYIIFDIVNETNMVESVRLAQLIQQKTCATAHRTNKGVKQDAFLVLRETSMPACLIELGYITTPSEATYLTSREGVNAFARGIYQAFVAYRGQQAAPVTVPAAPQNSGVTTSDTTSSSPSLQRQQDNPSPSGGSQDAAVFKVQILASTAEVPSGDRQFKGLTGVECYREGNMWKYTVGSSTDYNEIVRLRRSILDKFPQAFIVAFKNGQKVDTQAAIQEFRLRN